MARHPGTVHFEQLFKSEHLPPHLREVAVRFEELAAQMVLELGDGPELSAGLRKLLEAKDCCVRQRLLDRKEN